MADAVANVGIVVIARNEGERLKRCLKSVSGQGVSTVYVDSGSIDGSVAFATIMGVEVLRLNPSTPFTMARARNEGFTHLLKMNPSIQFVQFIDGDCELEEGWIQTANAWMVSNPETAVVCGRRREKFPRASIYNMLCDIEWNKPPGVTDACGGDALIRVDAFKRVGGFDPSLVAGEEPELCARMRSNRCKIYRLPENMTRHDAALTSFKAWWKRMTRCGYGAKDVIAKAKNRLNNVEVPFQNLTRSAVVWCDGWCLFVMLIFGITYAVTLPTNYFQLARAMGTAFSVGLFAHAFQSLRTAWRIRGRGCTSDVLIYALFTQIAKLPQRIGQLLWLRDHMLRTPARLIEYKA